MKNLKAPLLSFVFLLALASVAWAEEPKTAEDLAIAPGKDFPGLIFNQPESVNKTMDIPPSTFADFWKKWHFVSARWRQDVREIRLTYANDLAWKTLMEQRTDYPVGAMFGKLVYPAEEDLALPSSVMSSNRLNRFMVMLWDPKHKKVGSDGWVYLRFINPDPRAPQDRDSTGIWGVMAQKEIDSCVECHTRAYDRGNVFSQPMFLFYDNPKAASTKDNKILSSRYGESMHDMGRNTVPRIAVNLIDNMPNWKSRKIKGYAGNFFAGALGEMGPVLGKLAQEHTDTVYLIYDRDDPNTLEVVSSIQKKGYENCVGLVRLQGRGLDAVVEQKAEKKRFPESKGDESYYSYGQQGGRIRDMSQEYKPVATLFTVCGEEGIDRQSMPLLYKAKDTDGLPSYYFAQPTLDKPEKE